MGLLGVWDGDARNFTRSSGDWKLCSGGASSKLRENMSKMIQSETSGVIIHPKVKGFPPDLALVSLICLPLGVHFKPDVSF